MTSKYKNLFEKATWSYGRSLRLNNEVTVMVSLDREALRRAGYKLNQKVDVAIFPIEGEELPRKQKDIPVKKTQAIKRNALMSSKTYQEVQDELNAKRPKK